MHVCPLQKCLSLDLFVIVVKLLFKMSVDIYFRGNRQIWVQNKILHLYKIMAAQQGQPQYSFGCGKHDPCPNPYSLVQYTASGMYFQVSTTPILQNYPPPMFQHVFNLIFLVPTNNCSK